MLSRGGEGLPWLRAYADAARLLMSVFTIKQRPRELDELASGALIRPQSPLPDTDSP